MASTSASAVRPASERRFFGWMTLAILAVVFVGFSRSFFLRPLFSRWPSPAEPIFYVHGTAFTAWILLLVAQARLVAAGRTDLHRRAGVFGAALAVVMLSLGVTGALVAARRPTGFIGIPVPRLQFLVVPFTDMALFALFVGLAIVKRDDPQSHKRLMLIATLDIITAALARWPGVIGLGPPVFFGLTDLFLVPLLVCDFRTRGRPHPVTLWAGLLLIASQPLRLMLSGTRAWLAFAQWAVGLLG